MRVQRAADVMEQELDGQFLLLRTGSSDVLHLDDVASDVWRLLAEPTSRQEMVEDLAAAYGVAQERVAHDLEPVLQLLLARGVAVERQDA